MDPQKHILHKYGTDHTNVTCPSKAKKDLGWLPEITLDEMVQEMVAHDLSKAKQHALLKGAWV